MEISINSSEHSLLRIRASTTDKISGKLLYEYIVELAKDTGIEGATVYRGIMGFGSSSKITSSKFWELTEKLPVVIELVDRTENLRAFFTGIEADLINMPKGCMVTLEPTEILLKKKGR